MNLGAMGAIEALTLVPSQYGELWVRKGRGMVLTQTHTCFLELLLLLVLCRLDDIVVVVLGRKACSGFGDGWWTRVRESGDGEQARVEVMMLAMGVQDSGQLTYLIEEKETRKSRGTRTTTTTTTTKQDATLYHHRLAAAVMGKSPAGQIGQPGLTPRARPAAGVLLRHGARHGARQRGSSQADKQKGEAE